MKLSTILFGVVFAVTSGQINMSNAQEPFYELSEIPNAVSYNCGLSTSIFVLRTFDKQCSLLEASEALDCGPQWEYATDLAAIQALLVSKGVGASGRKNITLANAIKTCCTDGMVLLHLKTSLTSGHFLILLAADDERVCVVDAGRKLSWFLIDKFLEEYSANFTGLALVMPPTLESSFKEKNRQVHPLGPNRKIKADLGTVFRTPSTRFFDIPIFNATDKNLKIQEVVSSCSCVTGLAFGSERKSLPPSEHGNLRLEILPTKLPTGKNVKQIMVKFESSNQDSFSIILQIHVNVVTSIGPRVMTWLPSRITLDSTQAAHSQDVRVFLPPGVSIWKILTSSKMIEVIGRQRVRHRPGSLSTTGRNEERIKLVIRVQKGSELKGTVKIFTTSPKTSVIEVPIIVEK